MLGRTLSDPEGTEGPPQTVNGLGLLDIETVMGGDKHLARVSGHHLASSEAVEGYEIHIGRTEGPDRARPFLEIEGRPEGAVSPCGRVAGAYIHGLVSADGFRATFLKELGAAPSDLSYTAAVEQTLDALAAHMEAHLDVAGLLALAKRERAVDASR